MSKKTVSLEEIKHELNKNCACVVLIDAAKIHGVSTNEDINSATIKEPSSCCLSTTGLFTSIIGYCGHFIVVIGYDQNRQLIFYRNPSCTKTLSYASEENFEISRKAFGTDEDIVFIYV